MAKARLAQMAAEEAERRGFEVEERYGETDAHPDPDDDDPLRDPPPPRWIN
jgi:hypothetical protein